MTGAPSFPDLVPVLGAGRHRNPRKGACFMEMASYLAGERWSDHPRCTHPLLASLARMVNDTVPDADRSQLVTSIPDVVGLVGDDLLIDLTIATRAAVAALPVAPGDRQNVLAVGLLTCDRRLSEMDTPHARQLRAAIAGAFRAAPHAERWARRYARDTLVADRALRRQTAPRIVAYAVEGLAVACIPDGPARLVALLTQCIAETRQVTEGARATGGAPTVVPTREPDAQRMRAASR
ncbi:MAG TPA: hypothetical protein VES95_05820 [Dermatophilaceae bacterium]|nr:hypothetical protein [Dermatophilaceae bacterium]